MKKSILSLNFMYGMERFATQIYLVQKGRFKDSGIVELLTEAAKNEKTHVQRLRAQIIKLNGKVYPWGWLFQSIGFVTGCFTSIIGKHNLFKMNTFVENRAVRDYGGFVKSGAFDDDTANLIREIISDEERHVVNWKAAAKN